MPFPRASGILLHPTSFPSRFGIGDLGLEAYRFIDFLADSAQQLWQILPLGPTGEPWNSPYLSSYSSMAGNHLLISLEVLRDKGLLAKTDLTELPEMPPSVDFGKVRQIKMPLLQKAWQNFQTNASAVQQKEFEGFCKGTAYWLDDYALFMALKEAFQDTSWPTWEPAISKRQPDAIAQWQDKLQAEIWLHKFLQFEFFQQWSALRKYANLRGIKVIGDISIYVSQDSADVWGNPENFCLDPETGEPALMAGVPPDYFSETGQLWGNPVYNWERLQQTGFKWWVQRFQALFDYVDMVRVDHFRGFQAYWAVQQGETTAMNGEWIEAPGEALFETLQQQFGQLPVLAEDLGVITPEVDALRDRFGFPSMKILQFAFGDMGDKNFLPFRYLPNSVVYPGTHDNETIVGWFNRLSPSDRDMVINYVGCLSPEGINWDFTRLALASVSNQAIIQLQDVLGLGNEGRMNDPSDNAGNWTWRYEADALTPEVRDRLKSMTELFGRAPQTQS
ncbi:MAG: 4-alpha-glucanotransferase [Trichocoleus desertorum ATA4-8-CV12]|jgi:4-alpha-glucanotransferase|nr:4-alpha-glucanotransferase [Trichocoleus desertorum ATA4-8-CV12]